ncbi:MAG TPA: hypothetical protein VM802_00590 [Chitinophaga sp.]|uniref:hypothetical protein n=1 Tax=Chitinophaga sp. TaxID=1869181 RepID=UPI002B52E5D9|nr:hypothetical protein [Chitinophaga sp.]HVI43327.1 hypothetical protein [Chitinophaga sp.]
MEYKKISALLEKYWEGETSLEEEALLRRFFSTAHPDMPDDLKEAMPLFQFFHEEEVTVYELPPLKEFPPAPEMKVVTMSPLQHWMKYAAVLLMAIGIGYAMKQQQRQERVVAAAWQHGDIEDPQRAFDETKKALQLLARNLNKGTDKMQKLSYFNEATDKIEGKN